MSYKNKTYVAFDGDTDMAYINGTILESVGDSAVSKNNWGIGYEKDGKLYVKIGNN